MTLLVLTGVQNNSFPPICVGFPSPETAPHTVGTGSLLSTTLCIPLLLHPHPGFIAAKDSLAAVGALPHHVLSDAAGEVQSQAHLALSVEIHLKSLCIRAVANIAMQSVVGSVLVNSNLNMMLARP